MMLQKMTKVAQRALVLCLLAFTAPVLSIGSGASDFFVRLAGEYSLQRTSGYDIKIVPDSGWSDDTPIIPTMVVECAVDRHFILAKRQGMKKDSGQSRPDPSVFDYWILDTSEPTVMGPMTMAEFATKRKSLGIADSVVLSDVYRLRYQSMRDMILNSKKDAVDGIDASKPWCVLMETGYPKETVSLVAFMGGYTSLCASDGELRAPGLGPWPELVTASDALLAEAVKHISESTVTKDTPLPTPGTTTFYLVTLKDIHVVSAKQTDLEQGSHAAAPLFRKANEVIKVMGAEAFATPYKQQE